MRLTNLVLMPESREGLELSRKLGFEKTLFLGKELVLVVESNKRELLRKIKEGKKKNLMVVVKPESEELLRFCLEKTAAELVFGQELINKEDSLHFPRGGLDQIICKIAKERNKIIGFSFSDILNSEERDKLIGRMMFNLKLCRKYQVRVFLGNFSLDLWEMRARHELEAFLRVLGEQRFPASP